MPLGAGERLGPYEIHARIGAGGMGEVYKARDTRLGRDVAIKVSAAEFSERFEREARTIAALNHPNICTLYDVGPNYLVMELVQGRTLAEVIVAAGRPEAGGIGVAGRRREGARFRAGEGTRLRPGRRGGRRRFTDVPLARALRLALRAP